MHCLAGRALHQVVNGGYHHQTPARQLEADVTVVGTCQNFGLRIAVNALFFFYDADKRLLAVYLAVGLPDVFFG